MSQKVCSHVFITSQKEEAFLEQQSKKKSYTDLSLLLKL